MRTRCAGVIAIVSALLLPSASVAATCESLTGLAVKNGTVTMAHTVAPGAFTPPAGRAGAPGNTNVFARLGGFCRVAVTLKPAPRSDIKGEVWMPSSGWNGRLQVVGNGGFAGTIWFSQALSDPAGALSREKLTLVHEAVLNACDALDGARDGVLENPLACTFDPKVLACKAGSDPASCLTDAQVTTVQKVYAGPSNSRTGKPIYVGLERGSEPGWNRAPVGYAVDYFKYIVFKDPNWDPKALNYDRHVAQAATGDNLIFDANDANMSAFTRRGGKLLLYQGWGEPGIPPANLVRYYGEIQSNTSNASNSVRLFMVPGMGHCGGGTGVNTFDMVTALDQWVTAGKVPAQIPASRVRNGVPDRTRPLCAYPQIAIYKGSGSLDEATNFACGRR